MHECVYEEIKVFLIDNFNLGCQTLGGLFFDPMTKTYDHYMFKISDTCKDCHVLWEIVLLSIGKTQYIKDVTQTTCARQILKNSPSFMELSI